MSERNTRKRKNAAVNENAPSSKRKKAIDHECPYNLRSHAHPRPADATNKAEGTSQAQASTSEVPDWQAERCTICLSTFGRQLVGTPGSCAHSFCLKCLQKWAKESNTCPVGRQKFTHICVRKQLKGRVVRKVQVKSPRKVMVGFQGPHFTSVHELQISFHQRLDGRAHNQEQLMMLDGSSSLAIFFAPVL